jgi:hypothetical protein
MHAAAAARNAEFRIRFGAFHASPSKSMKRTGLFITDAKATAPVDDLQKFRRLATQMRIVRVAKCDALCNVAARHVVRMHPA